MVSGMVRQMLQEVHQTDLCFANRKHPSQGFVRYAIHKLDLFSLVTRELLSAESGDRVQYPVVRPAVVFVE
jgi:hypothetical protein